MTEPKRTKPIQERDQDPSESINARVYFASEDHYKAEIKARELYGQFSTLCGDYLWERDPPSFTLFQTDSRLHFSSFGISMSFGDGFLDEWYLVDQLFVLTEICPDICIGFPDTDNDPILIESGEVLPRWVNSSDDIINRLFIHQGSVNVIIPSLKAVVDSMAAGAEYLLGVSTGKYPGCTFLRNKQINSVISQKRLAELEERSKFPTHVSSIKVGHNIAQLLTAFPQLISVIIEHLPIDRDVNKAITTDNGILSSSPSTKCSVRFTRLQWAKLRSMTADEVAPFFRKLDADLSGQLIMSGLCCAIVRDAKMLALVLPVGGSHLRGKILVEKAMSECVHAEPLNAVPTDESWLFDEAQEEPKKNEEKIDTEPEEFTKILEKFFDNDEDDDDDSDEDYDDDTNECEYVSEEFEELEAEMAKLKMGESDCLSAFMDSMNAEGPEHVGPASVLFAQLMGRKNS